MISVLFFDLIKKHVDLQYSCPWFITITVSELLRNINSLYICPGVDPFELSSNIVHHLLSIDPLFIDSDGDVNSFPHKEYWRTCSCTVLFEHGE